MSIIIYHNPKCSKSRQALELLLQKGIKPIIIKYLETPPSAEKIQEILNKLNYEPRDLMRKKEKVYNEKELSNQSLSDNALIQSMVKHPILIERPIVRKGDKAIVARPPENVRQLL